MKMANGYGMMATTYAPLEGVNGIRDNGTQTISIETQ